jgi:hypothetical protein
MKMFLVLFFAAFSMLPSNNNYTAPATDEAELPRSIKVCWVVFGAEIICMTVEDNVVATRDLNLKAEFGSDGSYMKLMFPEQKSGILTAAETLKFDLCGASKTIRKGTKIEVRNGVANISL